MVRRWAVLMLLPLAALAQIWQEDTAFAPILESSMANLSFNAIAAPGGKVVVSTHFPLDSVDGVRAALVRLNPDGSIDPTFNVDMAARRLGLCAVYPDGRVLVSSASLDPEAPTFDLIRLLADGRIDPTFSPVTTTAGGTNFSVQILPDERILLAGFLGSIGGNQGLCLLQRDGSAVSSFHASIGIAELFFYFHATPMANGPFIIWGDFVLPTRTNPSRAAIKRLLADGSVDPTFFIPLASDYDQVFPEPDGRLLVFSALPNPGLTRFEANGQIDATFSFQPFNAPGAQPPKMVAAVAQQPDGKILVSSYDTSYQPFLSRTNRDGAVDPTFQRITSSVGPITFGNDGTMFVGAAVTDARLAKRELITHLFADGSVDPNSIRD